MTQPTPYARQYNFTGFSSNQPSDQQPGVQIDAEFNAVKNTLDGILSNLSIIQRDDGQIASGTVSLPALASDILVYFAGLVGWNLTGQWLTATAYEVGDVVAQDGNTYVCCTAHSSGSFAADLALVRWLVIWAPTTVANGSITGAKLADGAVTLDKVGFTELDLTGTIRAQTGLAAGTETAGSYAVGAKLASGNVTVSMARATRAQGSVGLRLDGGTSGYIWTINQATGSDNLAITDGTVTCVTFRAGGMTDFGYTTRFTGSGTPTTGVGVEITYSSSTGNVQAYDRDGAAWKDLKLKGLVVYLTAGGTDRLKVTATATQVLDGYSAFQDIGYRDLPLTASRSGGYTIALTDRGQCVPVTSGGVTIPANASVAFPVGSVVAIYNDSATAQNITITTDTLRLNGTTSTGTRSVPAYGIATLLKVKTTEWLAAGSVS